MSVLNLGFVVEDHLIRLAFENAGPGIAVLQVGWVPAPGTDADLPAVQPVAPGATVTWADTAPSASTHRSLRGSVTWDQSGGTGTLVRDDGAESMLSRRTQLLATIVRAQ